MGFGRFLAYRSAVTVAVLVLTILITVAVLGPTMDNILRRSVEQEVRTGLVQNRELVARFRNPVEFENFVRSQQDHAIEGLGLNQPWYSPSRLWFVAVRLLTLDLGQAYYLRSYSGSLQVREIIAEAIPRTILLFTTATIINALIGILIGVAVARRAGSFLDKITSSFAVVSNSFPLWWVGMLMIVFFAYTIHLLPARATPLIAPSDPGYLSALIYHMTLPLATLVLIGFGGWVYVVRNLVIGVLQEDYITVAEAKGVPERRILYGHALKSAAPPIITILALSLSGSLGGAIITEAVFDWPGIGRLYWEAVTLLDVPVIVGLTFVATAIFLAAIFITDILYAFFDPRVKVG